MGFYIFQTVISFGKKEKKKDKRTLLHAYKVQGVIVSYCYHNGHIFNKMDLQHDEAQASATKNIKILFVI